MKSGIAQYPMQVPGMYKRSTPVLKIMDKTTQQKYCLDNCLPQNPVHVNAKQTKQYIETYMQTMHVPSAVRIMKSTK